MELFVVSRRQVDGRFVEIADFATPRVNVHRSHFNTHPQILLIQAIPRKKTMIISFCGSQTESEIAFSSRQEEATSDETINAPRKIYVAGAEGLLL